MSHCDWLRLTAPQKVNVSALAEREIGACAGDPPQMDMTTYGSPSLTVASQKEQENMLQVCPHFAHNILLLFLSLSYTYV